MDNRLHFKGKFAYTALDNNAMQKKYQSEDSAGDSPNTPSSKQKAKKDF